MKRWIGVALVAIGTVIAICGLVLMPTEWVSATMFFITPGVLALLAGGSLIYADVTARRHSDA